MNPLEKLQSEHEEIEQELKELETIMEEEVINYSNLLHTFKKLHKIWNSHESKEEKVFAIMRKEKIIMPVKTMLMEHVALKPHKLAVENAIKAGSEQELHNAMNLHGKVIIQKLREHINSEDEVLYTVAIEQELTPEEVRQIETIVG